MIGILALQGGFQAHERILDRLHMEYREVKLPKHLHDLEALIIPGGESTTMLKLLNAFELFDPLVAFGNTGYPVLGTCAGAILMCRTVRFKNQKSLGWIPASIDRNAYGSQQESFQVRHDCPLWGLKDVPSLFIRAPRFAELSEGVSVLSKWNGDTTGVEFKNFSAVSYHPELGGDTRFHEAWVRRHLHREPKP